MIDISGKRFGRLLAIGFSYRNDHGEAYWNCKCDCGERVVVRLSHLKRSECTSCGCLRKEILSLKSFKHGHYANGLNNGSPTHICWMNMIKRCSEKKNTSFKNYGGRGIKVCERWRIYENFLCDMGEKPSPEHSIGRISNSGHYEPSNCR